MRDRPRPLLSTLPLAALLAGCAVGPSSPDETSPSAPAPKAAPAPEATPAPKSEAIVEPASPTAPKEGAITGPQPAVPGVSVPDGALMGRLRRALATKGAGYTPRTHHLNADGSPRFINRLILETSPYLLQHAHNPVNWYPWGEEAFERARREHKPVLLSVGYSTCHWCHVMERESFEDLQIAEFINRHFIAIKVDREERPDVDRVYMKAVQMMVGRGGWPMTVALTPERQPFFGGTYFPPRAGARGAQSGLLEILGKLHERFQSDPQTLVARAAEITRRLQASAQPQRPGDVPGVVALSRAALGMARRFDPVWGGFGGEPKFPRPVTIDFLLRYHRRTGDAHALKMATLTLEKMAAGGMYDHVGGGFHRYSTDAEWLVPHFEKMLYDNAQLASVYTQAWQITGREGFAQVAQDTLDYVAREMTDPLGAFWSATDADSPSPEGAEPGEAGHLEEGLYFTWTPAELSAVLGPGEVRAVRAYYGVTDGGNFEGRNILHTPRPLPTVAAELGMTPTQLAGLLTRARKLLYGARVSRPAPLTDRKIIAAWNGLMISAYAQAAIAYERPDYLQRAQRAADFVLERMVNGKGHLARTFSDGEARHEGVLADYAFMVQGLLDLFEAGGREGDLQAARRLQLQLDAHFGDVQGGYFGTARHAERLLVRAKPDYDGAEPSGNSVTLRNLLRFETITGDALWRGKAERLMKVFARTIAHQGLTAPLMLAGLEHYLDAPREVVIVWPEGADPERLLGALRSAYLPNRLIVTGPTEAVQALGKSVPLVSGKIPKEGLPTAYVCERGTCERPTSSAEILAEQLRAVRALGGDLPALSTP